MGIQIYCNKCRLYMDSSEPCYCAGCIKKLEDGVESLGEENIQLEKKIKELEA